MFESAIRYVQLPSVKIYATTEWSCDYVPLYIARAPEIYISDDRRRRERELSFGDICARTDGRKFVVWVCALSKRALPRDSAARNVREGSGKDRNAESYRKKRANVSSGSFALSGIRRLPAEQRKTRRIRDFNFSGSLMTSRQDKSQHEKSGFAEVYEKLNQMPIWK